MQLQACWVHSCIPVFAAHTWIVTPSLEKHLKYLIIQRLGVAGGT